MFSWLLLSIGLHAPTNTVAKAVSCNTVTLQWNQPSEPNDITTSVSCTPHSPGCAGCTTSPCTITDLNPSTEYVFTVTLNSGGCRASTNTTVTVETACEWDYLVVSESDILFCSHTYIFIIFIRNS